MHSRLNIVLIVTLISTLIVSIIWGVGISLSKPKNIKVTMPLAFTDVHYKSTKGSLLTSSSTKICALLMHGIRSNRESMINRAYILKKHGITSLLIDLQAHGETLGTEITFGVKESIDAHNGTQYLRQIVQCHKIVAIGRSLGGAAALLGNGPIDVDALVLESVYPSIETAVENRLEIKLGSIGKLLAPLLYWQIPIRINASLDALQPIKVLKTLQIPTYIVSGSLDMHTKVGETKRMYSNIKSKKDLWIVNGATHEDLLAYSPDLYESNIINFIDNHLK